MSTTRHNRQEIREISDALIELHKAHGSQQLQELGIVGVAELLLAQGDRPAGSWIFANHSAWYDFLRTNELVMRELETDGPKGPPPKRVA